MMTPAEVLNRLQKAWRDADTENTEAAGRSSTSMQGAELAAIIGRGGLATVACVVHLQPFDAIESEEPTRPGFIRSDCRRCGRFLGYRPKRNGVHFEERG